MKYKKIVKNAQSDVFKMHFFVGTKVQNATILNLLWYKTEKKPQLNAWMLALNNINDESIIITV